MLSILLSSGSLRMKDFSEYLLCVYIFTFMFSLNVLSWNEGRLFAEILGF